MAGALLFAFHASTAGRAVRHRRPSSRKTRRRGIHRPATRLLQCHPRPRRGLGRRHPLVAEATRVSVAALVVPLPVVLAVAVVLVVALAVALALALSGGRITRLVRFARFHDPLVHPLCKHLALLCCVRIESLLFDDVAISDLVRGRPGRLPAQVVLLIARETRVFGREIAVELALL